MTTGKFNFHQAKNGIILANTHRGYCSVYPENTMPAFEGALAAGTHCIEIDVMLSSDDEIMVIHDYSIDRTSNGTGFVDQLTCEELLTFDFGIKFGKDFEGTKIPLFSEVLNWAISNNVGLIVEAKQRTRQDVFVKEFVQLINATPNALAFIQLLSFDHTLINKVKPLLPEIALQVVTIERYNDQVDAVLRSNASCVCCEYEFSHIDDLRAYKAAGLGVRLYIHAFEDGVETMELYRRKFGVDAEIDILHWMREGLIDILSHDDVPYMVSLINKSNMKHF